MPTGKVVFFYSPFSKKPSRSFQLYVCLLQYSSTLRMESSVSSAMMVDLMLPSASISKVMSVRHPERMNASRPMPMARKHRCMSTREGGRTESP